MIPILKNIIGRRSYQYLLLKLAVFVLIAFILDFVVGSLFSHFYFKQTSGWEYRTKYSVEDTRADILIFGASRAQQQYNPVFFEERLHQTCYNVGRDGEPFFYHYGVLQGVLNRYKPKVIILDMENGVFIEDQSSYDRLAALLPFYNRHPEMRSLIEMRGPFEKYKLLSKIYPYNSLVFKIALGNTEYNKKRNEDIKGYVPLDRALDEPIRTIELSNKYPIDSNKVNLFESFLDECKKENIKIYLVCSPYYINPKGSDTSMVLAKKIARQRSIDFFDFSRDEEFLKTPGFFDDTVHVNFAGSKVFSNKLLDSIILKSR